MNWQHPGHIGRSSLIFIVIIPARLLIYTELFIMYCLLSRERIWMKRAMRRAAPRALFAQAIDGEVNSRHPEDRASAVWSASGADQAFSDRLSDRFRKWFAGFSTEFCGSRRPIGRNFHPPLYRSCGNNDDDESFAAAQCSQPFAPTPPERWPTTMQPTTGRVSPGTRRPPFRASREAYGAETSARS